MSTRASLMGPSRWRWGLRGGHEWGVVYMGAGDRGKGLAGVAAERVEHVCRESSPSLRCGSSGRAGDAGVGQDQQVQVSVVEVVRTNPAARTRSMSTSEASKARLCWAANRLTVGSDGSVLLCLSLVWVRSSPHC